MISLFAQFFLKSLLKKFFYSHFASKNDWDFDFLIEKSFFGYTFTSPKYHDKAA
jgi:hypothetical protein